VVDVTWQLRRAGLGDLDAIMTIERSVFETDAWSTTTMRAELADKHGYYVVAFPVEDSATIVAYAGLHSAERDPQADVQTIAVAESARRRGLGRVLMMRLIAEARGRGAQTVFLEVRADNPSAQQLYRSLGFEDIAVRPAYYQPDGVDAIVMRLTIPEPRLGVA
jgi:ribosomal-protein-alanine acetyltransferase